MLAGRSLLMFQFFGFPKGFNVYILYNRFRWKGLMHQPTLSLKMCNALGAGWKIGIYRSFACKMMVTTWRIWEWNENLTFHLHQKRKWSDIFDIEISEECRTHVLSAHLPKFKAKTQRIPEFQEYVQQDFSTAFLSTVNVLSQMLNVWYIYLHLVKFYGKCRYIHHALSVWVCFHYFVLIHQCIYPSTCCLVVSSDHFCPSQTVCLTTSQSNTNQSPDPELFWTKRLSHRKYWLPSNVCRSRYNSGTKTTYISSIHKGQHITNTLSCDGETLDAWWWNLGCLLSSRPTFRIHTWSKSRQRHHWTWQSSHDGSPVGSFKGALNISLGHQVRQKENHIKPLEERK